MLKRYYTLQEAAEYLSGKSDEPISIPDVLELVGDGKARLCAQYSGYVLPFWRDIFGSGCFWARYAPFYVRGCFCVEGAEERHVSRATKSFRLIPIEPVEIKEFDFSKENLIVAYKKHTDNIGRENPTREQLIDAAQQAGIELSDPELNCYQTTVEFGGFFSGTGWPEVDCKEISIDACLIPRDDLFALANCQVNTPDVLDLVQSNQANRGVLLDALKLYTWPLAAKNDDEKLITALRRPAKWVQGAIVGKAPLKINPARLAYALQEKTKSRQAGFFLSAKQLGNFLGDNFPDYFDEYTEMIDFDKNL